LEHKTGIDLTVSSTLKKPSKNYTCFISRRFGLLPINNVTYKTGQYDVIIFLMLFKAIQSRNI